MEKLSRDELRAKARRLTSDSLSLGTPHIQALRTVRLRDNVRKGWVIFPSSASSPKPHAAAVTDAGIPGGSISEMSSPSVLPRYGQSGGPPDIAMTERRHPTRNVLLLLSTVGNERNAEAGAGNFLTEFFCRVAATEWFPSMEPFPAWRVLR